MPKSQKVNGAQRKPLVVIAGLGDVGVLVATRLSRSCEVVAISTRPALVSGQELGNRLTDPSSWRRTYLVPYLRFRRLDRVRQLQGRIISADLDGDSVEIELSNGTRIIEQYDIFIIATGASNGFWRHDRIEDIETTEAGLASVSEELKAAKTIAVVGGGTTGVSVADNLARRGGAEVHLFHSGEQPLPGYHPKARSWITRVLSTDGVVLHPGHRAITPDGFTGDRLTHEPIEWATEQEPFKADVTLWAVGGMRPHSNFLPAEVLDDSGFVNVDEYLRLPGHENVFAVGDVAASDPHRSSARNWGFRVVVANVRAALKGRTKLKRYKAPEFRWGSILGLQPEGLTVVQPDGRRFRIPRWIAEPLLMRVFVTRYLYGGLRRGSRG
ncbi:unannotated protein [freshwater metagenome]|uniref:Unannotated protein n=1 Tax=freshwater metagenome TaxID=449393 RepID=A0A6J6LZH0_9ZZZZ|nr:pyridine nucleotide-disulfide oxidoreductase [Actinomycetota bacterium]